MACRSTDESALILQNEQLFQPGQELLAGSSMAVDKPKLLGANSLQLRGKRIDVIVDALKDAA